MVRLLDVDETVLTISAIDAFDGTPVLDVKPYVAGLDVKSGANLGWIESGNVDSVDHLELHIKGIQH